MAEASSRTDRANQIVKRHMLATFGAGLVPLPLVDLALLVGIQLNMLRRLAKLYEMEFFSQIATSLVASLLGGGVPVSLSATLSRLVGSVPIYGRHRDLCQHVPLWRRLDVCGGQGVYSTF